MGYNKNYNGNFNNNNHNNFNNNAPQLKKSGFEIKEVENDELGRVPICHGWRKTKNGLQKIYARPYSKSRITHSESGKKWINLFVTLTTDMQIIKTSGMFDLNKRKLYIKEFNLVGTTNGGGKTRSGKFSKGYFGKHIKH